MSSYPHTQSIFCDPISIPSPSNKQSPKQSSIPSQPDLSKGPTLQQMMYITKQKLQLEKILEKKETLIRIYKKQNQQLKLKLNQELQKSTIAYQRIQQYFQREQRVFSVKEGLSKDFQDLKRSVLKEKEMRMEAQRKVRVLEDELLVNREKMRELSIRVEEQKSSRKRLQEKIKYYCQEYQKSNSDIQSMKLLLVEKKHNEINYILDDNQANQGKSGKKIKKQRPNINKTKYFWNNSIKGSAQKKRMCQNVTFDNRTREKQNKIDKNNITHTLSYVSPRNNTFKKEPQSQKKQLIRMNNKRKESAHKKPKK